MDIQTYYEMAVVHTAQDLEVGWNDLDQAQKDLRAHSRALARIFKLGEAIVTGTRQSVSIMYLAGRGTLPS